MTPNAAFVVQIQPVAGGAAGAVTGTDTIPVFTDPNGNPGNGNGVNGADPDDIIAQQQQNNVSRALNLDGAIAREQLINERIKAQAYWMVSYGETQQRLADAYLTMQHAIDKELDNWRKEVRVYYDRREENLRRRMRMTDLYSKKADRYWELRGAELKRPLEVYERFRRSFNQASIAKGDSLNFMLDRFCGHACRGTDCH